MIGIENLDFHTQNGQLNLCFGTSYFASDSLSAFALFKFWREQADFTLTYGGSPDFHRFAEAWGYCHAFPVTQLQLNKGVGFESSSWRRVLKRIACFLKPKVKLAKKLKNLQQPEVKARLAESAVGTSQHSGWDFSLTANREYLQWRYPIESKEIVYKWYSISSEGLNCGFVILGSVPQKVFVALVDTREEIAAAAIAASFIQFCQESKISKELFLTTASKLVTRDLASMGFTINKHKRQMILCGSKKSPPPEKLWDTAGNACFDLGDNGLRLFFK